MPLLRRLNIGLTKCFELFDPTRLPQRVTKDIPYFAQWESPDLIADFINETKQASQDPLWANSGAKSPEHYQSWAKHCCGMACLKMIVADCRHQVIPIVQLAEDCATFGGYTFPLEQTVGLQYGPFQNYVRQTFDLDVSIARPLTIHKIKKALTRGNYVIASVASNIDMHPTKPIARGHMILITSYDSALQTITFHDPGARRLNRQANCTMTTSDFSCYFNHKGLIIQPNNS